MEKEVANMGLECLEGLKEEMGKSWGTRDTNEKSRKAFWAR